MCNDRQLRLWLVHVTKQFLSLNLTLPHPLQGSVPPEGFFLPHLFRGGWRFDLPLRKISCMLRSQMLQWKETNEPYGWTQGLPGMESPKLRQFPLCSHIPAVSWCAGAASESTPGLGAAVCWCLPAHPRRKIGTPEHTGVAAAPLPGSWDEEGSSWAWKLSESPPASALLGMNPSGSGAVPRLEEWQQGLVPATATKAE